MHRFGNRQESHPATNRAPATASEVATWVTAGAVLVAASSAVVAQHVARLTVAIPHRRPSHTEVLAFNDKFVLLTRSRASALAGVVTLVQGDEANPDSFVYLGDEVTDESIEDALGPDSMDGLWERCLRARSIRPVLRPILPPEDLPGKFSSTVNANVGPVSMGPVSLGSAELSTYVFGTNPMQVLGLPFEEVRISGAVNDLPAWVVDMGNPRSDTWIVMVHGRGASRAEFLRSLPAASELGFPTLVSTYRNSVEAPEGDDTSCHLGADEWFDTDDAIDYVVARGAKKIVLMGISMGGHIAVRASVFGRHRAKIQCLVLVAPALDWPEILNQTGKQAAVPGVIRRAALAMISSPRLVSYFDLRAEIPLHEMTATFIADHLRHPTLIVHSRDDDVVPFGASERVAKARPDLVTLETFTEAFHTHEWNVDRQRYDRVLVNYVRNALLMPGRVRTS